MGTEEYPQVLALAVRQPRPGPLESAYDADGLEVFGLGPGLTVLMGLLPPTPSAMAFKGEVWVNERG